MFLRKKFFVINIIIVHRFTYLMDRMSLPQTHQVQLMALAELAGISAVPGVYRVIMELLALHISPEDIHILLKQICQQSKNKEATENPEEIPNT